MSVAWTRWMGLMIVVITWRFNWSPEEFSLLSTKSVMNYLNMELKPTFITGLVLARAGSKGIPHKNMVDLKGHPLIYWALQAMIQSQVFKSIWVSTDDERMSKWLAQEFPDINVHRRADFTATDKASSMIAVREFLRYHPDVECLGLVQATSPFIRPIYLIEAKQLIENFDSVFSATRSHQLRWKSNIDPSQFGTIPINFDPKNRPRRQDWHGEMVENGMFYFVRREIIENYGLFQGPKSSYVEVPKLHSLEIDTPFDLEMARYLMEKYNSEELIP